MLWWLLSAFFAWLAFREIYHGYVPSAGYPLPNEKISKSYVLITALIAMALAYMPLRYWHFERFLTEKAKIMSESDKATVHCNTIFDTFFDQHVFASGHANIETGRIVFQHPWCGALMDHLQDPEKTTPEGIFSVQLFAHEAMHIRGERNEANTECQAIQRYARAAKLLGIDSDQAAKENGMFYYTGAYKKRAEFYGMGTAYYSDQCAPGKALDEKLPDSIWDYKKYPIEAE